MTRQITWHHVLARCSPACEATRGMERVMTGTPFHFILPQQSQQSQQMGSPHSVSPFACGESSVFRLRRLLSVYVRCTSFRSVYFQRKRNNKLCVRSACLSSSAVHHTHQNSTWGTPFGTKLGPIRYQARSASHRLDARCPRTLELSSGLVSSHPLSTYLLLPLAVQSSAISPHLLLFLLSALTPSA